MIARIKRAISRRWRDYPVPPVNRLVVKKAKWRHDSDSPVIFMIDDLTNAWVQEKGKELDGPDFDWGGKHNNANGVMSFLHGNLYGRFPRIRAVYFTVIGAMHSFNTESAFQSARAIDANPASIEFFRSIKESAHGEIAYHGLHHGVPSERSEDYVQEWASFSSVEEGLEVIKTGQEIYKRVFGKMPKGGKYGGYKNNRHSEKTLEESGFMWWCRDWTPRDTAGNVPDAYYEVNFFGNDRKMVSIPSTVHGGKWTRKQIDRLLAHKQVISVQEHISPRRPDGRVQTPNVYDDISELQKLFAYLERHNVWYATGSEVAEYFIGYKQSLVYDEQKDGFCIEYNGSVKEPRITVVLSAGCLCSRNQPHIEIVLPDGRVLPGEHVADAGPAFTFRVDLPVQNGHYSVKPVSRL